MIATRWMGQELLPSARLAVQEPTRCPRTMKENLTFGVVEMHRQNTPSPTCKINQLLDVLNT